MVGSSSSSLKSISRSSCAELTLSVRDNSITCLPEDVLFEIFIRLPLESIFKSKFVSKKWFFILSSPSFKTRLYNSRFNPPTPWALFYGLRRPVTKSVSTASPIPHALSGHDGFSFRFLYSEISPYNEQHNMYLLASSNGLVLCSTNTTFPRNYCVCNPLTEKWVSLPQPPSNDAAWVLHGFICESSSPTRTSYKVVRILECTDPPWTDLSIEIFFSNTGVWETYKVLCPEEITLRYPFLSNVVSRNEVLYWIEEGNRLITYDLKNSNKSGGEQCRLIDLPDVKIGRADYRCLGESEGFIMFSQCNNGELSFWALEEDYFDEGCVWRLVRKIKIHDMLAEKCEGWAWRLVPKIIKDMLAEKCEGWIWRLNHRTKIKNILAGKCDSKLEEIIELAYYGRLNLKPLAFNPANPNVVILVLSRKREHCFTYNIRTGRLEMLESQGSPYIYASGEVFPYVVMLKSTFLPSLCYPEQQTLAAELVGDLRYYYYFN